MIPSIEDWAQGMVESTTEFDWAMMPAELRSQLVDWCERFNRWADEQQPTL